MVFWENTDFVTWFPENATEVCMLVCDVIGSSYLYHRGGLLVPGSWHLMGFAMRG